MSIIQIQKVRKTFKKNIIALKNISIDINKKDFFAILGKNGAGKSTIIGILTSLIKKDFGKILVFNYDIDINFMKVKSLIGFVPQEYNFNQFETVLDIILNQAGFYGVSRITAIDIVKEYLIFFDLWKKRNDVSITLSGGMKRRLMIIRALVHNPSILILDEPTAGVDVLSRRLIWNFLKNINKLGKTIILTTHYLEEVENLCNNVAIIDNGSILSITNVKNLLNKFNKKIFLFKLSKIISINNLTNSKFNIKLMKNNKIEFICNKKHELNFFLKYLIDNNIEIKNINTKHKKLEELFINIINIKK